MALLLYARRRMRRERVFRDRHNPLDFMGDAELMFKYRLSRASIIELCQLLRNDVHHFTGRNDALPDSL